MKDSMKDSMKELGLTDIDDIELSGRFNKKDKDIILKMMMAEHIHDEVKDEYREMAPRGL